MEKSGTDCGFCQQADIAWGDVRGGESGPTTAPSPGLEVVLHVVLGSFRLPSSLPRSSLPPVSIPAAFEPTPAPAVPCVLLPGPPGPATPSTAHPLPRHDTAFPIRLDHEPADLDRCHDHDHDPTTLWPVLGLIPPPIKVADIYFVCPFRLFVFSTSSSSVPRLLSTSGHWSSSLAAGTRATPTLGDLTKRTFRSKRSLTSKEKKRHKRVTVHQHTPFTEIATEPVARSLRSLPAASLIAPRSQTESRLPAL